METRHSIFSEWDAEQLDELFGRILAGEPDELSFLAAQFEGAGIEELSERELLRVVRILRYGTHGSADFILLAEVFAGTTLEGYVFGADPATRPFRRALAGWREQRLRARRRRLRRADPTPSLFEDLEG